MDHTSGSLQRVLWTWPRPGGWTFPRREDVVLGLEIGHKLESPDSLSCPTSHSQLLAGSSSWFKKKKKRYQLKSGGKRAPTFSENLSEPLSLPPTPVSCQQPQLHRHTYQTHPHIPVGSKVAGGQTADLPWTPSTGEVFIVYCLAGDLWTSWGNWRQRAQLEIKSSLAPSYPRGLVRVPGPLGNLMVPHSHLP